MTNETKLPAGVWRDDKSAEKLMCASNSDCMCSGTQCAACREYRVVTETDTVRVHPDSREVMETPTKEVVVGYYCGLAGRP